MSDSTNSISKIYKLTQILFVSLLATQLMFGSIVFLLIYSGQLGEPDYTLAIGLQQVAMLAIPASMGTGYFTFKGMVGKINRDLPVIDRLKKYQSAFLLRAALFEAPFLFLCVCAFITREKLFLYIAPVILLSFVLLRPSAEAISSDLELSAADREKLTA